MALHTYLTYLLATIVIVMVPGPTVTLVVASGMRHGARAALLNVAGTLAGIMLVFAVVGVGLASVIAAMGGWFDYIRFIGAAYLVWIGLQMLFSHGGAAEGAGRDRCPEPAALRARPAARRRPDRGHSVRPLRRRRRSRS